MHVTLGEDGSGLSKPAPRFLLPEVGNMGEACQPFMLPLGRSLRLREVEREVGWSRERLGLWIEDLEIFMEEEEERREVKQMKSSLVAVVVLLPVRWVR